MQFSRPHSTLLILLGAGVVLAGSVLSLIKRAAVERENRTVTFAVESDTLSALAAGSKMRPEAAMSRLKAAGFSGIVLGEQTIGEVISEGRAVLGRAGDRLTLTVFDPPTRRRALLGLRIRFGDLLPPISPVTPLGAPITLPAGIDGGLIRSTPIFLPPTACELARKAGWTMIARAGNPVGLDAAGVESTLMELRREGATVFLPQGDTVIGRREGKDAAVEAMERCGMLYASPEFTKLGGDIEMLKAIPERSVRLHSAQAAELDKLSPNGAVDRFVKAAAERGMRILLLRPMGTGSESPLESFAVMGEEIRRGIGRSGLQTGTAAPFRDPEAPRVAGILIGFGTALVVLGTALLLGARRLFLLAAGAIAFLAAVGTLSHRGIQISALIAALSFPFAGFLFAYQRRLVGPLAVLVSTGFALIGGLAVAGLLNGLPYLVRAEAFAGVKVAVFLPVAAIGAYAFSQLADFRGALRSPITWGAALTGLVVLAVLGILIVRSGNDAPAGVSGGELAFRGLLENLLPVRPRTKEFLIGFPALVFGFAWLASAGYDRARLRGAGGWVALLLMLGGIALTDVVNTFCHIHTPLAVSGLRVALGLLVGGVLGSVLWLIFRKGVLRTIEPLPEAD